jgi:hypothetical protein
MILIEPYTEFLIRHKIKPEQYLMLCYLYFNRLDLLKQYKNTFPKASNKMLTDEDLEELIAKRFIILKDADYKLSDTFIASFATPAIVVDEFYAAYPPFLIKDNGMSIPLLGMDKEVFKTIYLRKIKNSLAEHQEILKDIEYAKTNNLILIGIDKFLTSEQWKVIRVKRIKTIKVNTEFYGEDF